MFFQEQNLSVLEEVLRMVLEIFNSCLSNQLVHNPNLIYTLLYKKHIFEPFRDNVAFQDIIQNIDLVIKYYSNLLSQMSQYDLDVGEVLKTIQNGVKDWPKEKLKVITHKNNNLFSKIFNCVVEVSGS